MKLFKVLTISLPLLLTACAEQSSRSIESQLEAAGFGIQGGELVTKTKDPVTPKVKHVLAMIHQEGLKPHCAGVQIAPQLVLTAAHCLVELKEGRGWIPAKNMNVATCIDKRSEGCSWTPVKSYIIHEDYYLANIKHPEEFKSVNEGRAPPNSSATDIAVLLLSKNTNSKVYIPFSTSVPEVGDDLFIYGSGRTHKDNPLDLMIRTVILKADHTINHRPADEVVSGNYLVLHSSTQGICHGDSGGPVFTYQNNRLVLSGLLSGGLARDGYACGSWAMTAVDLSHSLNWIKTKSAELLGKPLQEAQNKK